MAEAEMDLKGRTPVPTRFHWDAVQMTTADGVSENYVVLQVETAQGSNVYFLPKEIATQVAAGLARYAAGLPDEQQASPGLIVPDVDMNEVIKHINGDGGAGHPGV